MRSKAMSRFWISAAAIVSVFEAMAEQNRWKSYFTGFEFPYGFHGDGEYAGTGRMLPDGHMGRLAVLKSFRGRGLGKELILKLLEEAAKRGIRRVFPGAQEHAVGFYRHLGFSEYGEPYEEAGIRHIYRVKFIQSKTLQILVFF